MIDISTDLDLFEKQTINITRRSQDFSEITSKESEFSRTFLGPVSKKNLEALDNYGLITANSTFNPHKGIECIWTVSTSSRFEGRLEVRKVIYENGDPKSIEFVFYGKQRTLANIIGTDRFSQVDWGEYDHTLTYANVRGSWGGGLLSGVVRYPLVDTRVNYFFAPFDLNIKGNIANENQPILLTDLKPAIKIRNFLSTIFSHYGLTLEGSLITGTGNFFDDLFILPNRLSGASEDPATFDDSLTKVTGATSALITSPASESIITLVTEVVDPENQWNGTDTFTAAIAGGYTISITLTLQLTGTTTPFTAGEYTLVIRRPGILNDLFFTIFRDNEDTFGTFIVFQSTIELDAGDTFQLFLIREDTGFQLGKNCQIQGGVLEVISPTNVLGNNVDLGVNMPDVKIVDWISKLFKSWNLLIIPDDFDANKYSIASADEWYDGGVVRDWSKMTDIKNLVYSKRKVFKELDFKYTETDSSAQQVFKNATGGRAYGQLRVRPDVEFGEDKLTIENPCTLIPPAVMLEVNANGQATQSAANVIIHKSIDGEGSPVAEPWLLFYFNGTKSASGSNYYLQDGLNGPTPTSALQTSYPLISSVQGSPSESDDFTLAYSLENPLIGVVATETAYKLFFQNTIINQYDILSRKLESVQVYLSTSEFQKYKLNDEIYMEGNYFRIVEIRHDASDGNKAIATLQSSRTNNSPKAYVITPGGKVNFTGDPTQIDLTSIGAISIGSDFYLGTAKVSINPNLSAYALAEIAVNTEITIQINALGGRFRTWNDEA